MDMVGREIGHGGKEMHGPRPSVMPESCTTNCGPELRRAIRLGPDSVTPERATVPEGRRAFASDAQPEAETACGSCDPGAY